MLNHLKTLAALANEFDKSGDPAMQKYASVLDEILLTISAPKGAVAMMKAAEDAEIEKLKAKYQKTKEYTEPHEILAKENKADVISKAVSSQVKEYRPMEAPLDTRYCPDHPGVPVMRITDRVVQCALDKKIYDYSAGFTTLKGNRVPGTSAALQTAMMSDAPPGHVIFDTRESMLSKANVDNGLVKNASVPGGISSDSAFIVEIIDQEAQELIEIGFDIDSSKLDDESIRATVTAALVEFDEAVKAVLPRIASKFGGDADELWGRDAAKCAYFCCKGLDDYIVEKWGNQGAGLYDDETCLNICDRLSEQLRVFINADGGKVADAISDAVLEAEVGAGL